MEYIKSNKGGVKLLYEGFVYVKSKTLKSDDVSFECEMRRNHKQCKARLRVNGDSVVGRYNDHTHAPDIGRAEALKIRQSIKRRAVDTEETPQQVITQEMRIVSDSAAVKLPAIRNIRRCVRRYRQVAGNAPANPQTRADLELPEEYTRTLAGQPFLLFDSGPVEDRILLLSTDSLLRTFETSLDWFVDGTFKVVPSIFYQLFTIHAMTNGHVVPCVFALLPNKQQVTYVTLLRELHRLSPELSPRSIMIDFEIASRNALQDIFPDATIQGCFYHLSQAIYRKVQSIGLQQEYQTNLDLSLKIRMLAALAFVPVDDIVESFEHLADSMPDEAQPITDYFEDTYIGRLQRRGRRRQPPFAHDMWSVHNRVEEGLPRTNNHIEGWHRRMQSNVGAHHPSIWHFLDVLRREQSLNEVIITQIRTGQPAPPQRGKYKAVNERLVTVVRDYANRSVHDFLRGIAHNIQM